MTVERQKHPMSPSFWPADLSLINPWRSLVYQRNPSDQLAESQIALAFITSHLHIPQHLQVWWTPPAFSTKIKFLNCICRPARQESPHMCRRYHLQLAWLVATIHQYAARAGIDVHVRYRGYVIRLRSLKSTKRCFIAFHTRSVLSIHLVPIHDSDLPRVDLYLPITPNEMTQYDSMIINFF